MFEIIYNFEGANCKVLGVDGENICLDVELRDTVEDWFFWCFKVVNAGGKKLTFTFPSSVRVGYYGAAVSHDYKTWRWQYAEPTHLGDTFTYTFAEGENEVYFAHDILYRPDRFYEKAKEWGLAVKTLCRSERGRAVPYLEFGVGKERILLTARHHACEATGSYVLEGVVEGLLRSALLKQFRILCVPFVDYDGVVDGDQGKGRNGHDHNRDYEGNTPAIYKSTAAIRRMAENCKLRFAFDFHSPWHALAENDTLFIPIKHYDILKNIVRFSNLFEQETVDSDDLLPHYAKDNLYPDTKWNTFGAPCFGTYMGRLGAELSFTLETPYFKATDRAFTPQRGVRTGQAFVRALEKYLARPMHVGIVEDIL